jgi:PAS domain S-box-containing protein
MEHAPSVEQKADNSDQRYREIFDDAHVALWVVDFSDVVNLLDEIRAAGVHDLRSHLQENPEIVREALRRLRVLDVNAYAVEMFEAENKAALLNSLADIFLPETEEAFIKELVCIWQGGTRFESESVLQTLKGRKLAVAFTLALHGSKFEKTLVSILDIADRKATEVALIEQTRRLATFYHIAQTIAADLDLESIIQRVVDAGTELSGAQYGAFFYHRSDQEGERHLLYALSGAAREAVEQPAAPGDAKLIHPALHGREIIRSANIRTDSRFGNTAAQFGMPFGRLPVASYLAAPVISHSNEVLGSLHFGHSDPAVFSKEIEDIVSAVAAHTAVAIDNARLLQSARTELEQRRRADRYTRHFKALIESSDDAIVSKDLNGIITSWNPGAEKLFGYSAADVIGQPITILIPQERQDEEPEILSRIRRGEQVHHYETIRQRKDGSLIDISLTVSPIKDQDGHIIGASKIARDITDRKIAEQQQQLMLREMNHRVANLFSLASSMVTSSARAASSTEELGNSLRQRLDALARAHALTISDGSHAQPGNVSESTLQTLIRTILLPYNDRQDERVLIHGIDVPVSSRSITNLALLLYESATNAAKYGALSVPGGRIEIECRETADSITLTWKESGGPAVSEPTHTGFGSRLVEATANSLSGTLVHEWNPAGLTIRLSFPRPD